MYLDREQGSRVSKRTGNPSAATARRAIEARATIDPEILRRWRGPAGVPEQPENEARREVPSNPAEAVPTAPEIDRPGATPDNSQAQQPKGPSASRKLMVFGFLVAAIATAAGWYGYRWWTVGRFIVSTDDAYVRANNTTLAAKVSGYVASILVADNSYVRAGDVIATLDDVDYRLAVDSARQKVATQQATVERFARQVAAQQASVEQAKAQLVSAQAGATRAQLEYERQQALAGKEFASRQALEQAIANRDQSIAGVQNAQAAVEAAEATVDVLKAQQQEAARTLDELKTAQAKAERDLSFAVIRAPVDGVIGNRAMQVGDFVQPGQRLASLVPLDEVYIDANFKETQLAGLKAGQKVAISVDALPGRSIEGTVASLSPASGSVFSLLPPDNATGNFTKIVQRVPVRIQVPTGVTGERLLRPGMSVVVSVNTKPEQRNGQPIAAASAGRDTKAN
jgi:membrane fusion protein (multidrug efflux system)